MHLYYCLYKDQCKEQKEKAGYHVGHKAGYDLLSYALEKEYGICELPKIEKGRYGKPYFPEYPQIHFNISHCDGMAACVTAEHEVGIDVEGRRRIRQALVNKVLTENERIELQKCGTDEFEMGFLRYWTLKESFIKAIGRGLSFPLKDIEFSIMQENLDQTVLERIVPNLMLLSKKSEHMVLNLTAVSSNQKDWQFFQTVLEKEYLLSICFHKEEGIQLRDGSLWDGEDCPFKGVRVMWS